MRCVLDHLKRHETHCSPSPYFGSIWQCRWHQPPRVRFPLATSLPGPRSLLLPGITQNTSFELLNPTLNRGSSRKLSGEEGNLTLGPDTALAGSSWELLSSTPVGNRTGKLSWKSKMRRGRWLTARQRPHGVFSTLWGHAAPRKHFCGSDSSAYGAAGYRKTPWKAKIPF